MCLAMNPDKLAPGERCASTSNRNFEGRQGYKGRTHLVSPAMAAAAAIAGHFVTCGSGAERTFRVYVRRATRNRSKAPPTRRVTDTLQAASGVTHTLSAYRNAEPERAEPTNGRGRSSR